MSSHKFFDELDYDNELKACNISKPYDALKSDFAKKILNNLSKKTKFKEWYIERIIEKLTDEEQEFTEEQRDDLFNLMDQNQEFFDSIVERYKGQFPAWVQSSITNKSLDMQQEDHILYENGKYVWLDKIKLYVNSRIEDAGKKDRHHIKIRSQDLPETDEQRKEKQRKEKLWEKIINFANEDKHDTQGVELLKLKKLDYSEEVNDKGITISNLNGIKFLSMVPAEEFYSSFTINNFNALTENNADEPLPRIKTDSKLAEFIQDVGAKPFSSIEECTDFQYKLMQIIADQLGVKVTVNKDFMEDPANDELIEKISSWLYALTRKTIYIPYRSERGGSSINIIVCEDYCNYVFRDYNCDADRKLSFFLEVDPMNNP